MPQANPDYAQRLAQLQKAMKEFGLEAIVLEPGPAMMYLTGVRWGKSERTFAVVLPAKGAPVWVLPGFEEMRARELIQKGEEIHVWQEDESPYALIAQALKERDIAKGRVGIDDGARFFVFDGIRKNAPKLDYTSATQVLKASGVQMDAGAGGRKK
jgi:Xaa-Pro dipeptidase